jgi:hypothetical protein
MLNSIVFVNRVPNQFLDTIVYHGTSRSFAQQALTKDRWFFGRASNYQQDGEGALYPGETEAINEFFGLSSLSHAADAASATQIHTSIQNTTFDLYNTCWSLQEEVAKKFASRYSDGVVISARLGDFVEAMKSVSQNWTNQANCSRVRNLNTLSSGIEDADDVGWGTVHASSCLINYLPDGYSHLTLQSPSRTVEFLNPLLLNMRLPRQIESNVLSEEQEVRFTFSLTNSDGGYFRSPNGPGSVLEPMIIEGDTLGEKVGIWVYGLKINTFYGFSLISLDLL